MSMKKRKGFRKLVVHDKTWQYKVGKNYVVLYSPNEEKHVVQCVNILPYFERGQWKKTEDGMIKPSQVVRYIQEEL